LGGQHGVGGVWLVGRSVDGAVGGERVLGKEMGRKDVEDTLVQMPFCEIELLESRRI